MHAASPITKEPAGQRTQGWHDIYLTNNRICKKCQMIDLGNERVLLRNKSGVSAEHWSTEIIGVDYHPLQRKFWLHFVNSINPHAARTLFPEAVEEAELKYPYFVYPAKPGN